MTIPTSSNVFVVTVPSNPISLALIDPQTGSQTSTQAHLVDPEPTALVLFATGMGWLAWLKPKNPRISSVPAPWIYLFSDRAHRLTEHRR